MSYETVIGLEIHVQLATRTKMFCGDAYEYGAEPNTRVCPVCLGLPGALPVPNGAAVELAVRAALGLGCTVHGTSVFARKNYFYPDLPKGYQITQYDRPLATGGLIDADGPVRIRRLHMEEDTGKSDHERFDRGTALDFNRAGVPLIEIVTEPDLRSPDHARAFLVRLKRVLEYLDVSDCEMEKGSLRVDANLSVRLEGADVLGTKTELKNLNSFANVERALRYEAERQAAVLEAGGVVIHETRLWEAGAGEARVMRSKEEAHDYRYFPEPDLQPLVLAPETIAGVRDRLPELPEARAARFRSDYGIPEYDAAILTASRALADYFEATLAGRVDDGEDGEAGEAGEAGHARDAAPVDPKAVSNRIMTDVLAWLNERGAAIDAFPVPPEWLAGLVRMVDDGTISGSAGTTVLARMAETGRSAAEVVEAEGLAQVSDQAALERWVDDALAAHPDEAARLTAGEGKLIGFFMGHVMAASGGKADPKRAAAILRGRVGKGRA